ncbi:MAG: histidine phosphatase family protein, partial [Deinococcales bacterium]
NVSGRFQGQTDVALSEEGREQARRLARHVRGLERGAVVYASPLVRARETAEIAFPRREIRLDPRLSELDFGAFEGSTQEENERHEAWAWWIADPYQRPAPGGESYRQLRERAVAWMEELSRAGSGPDHVVAVSHSGSSEAVVERVNDTRHLAAEGADPFLD